MFKHPAPCCLLAAAGSTLFLGKMFNRDRLTTGSQRPLWAPTCHITAAMSHENEQVVLYLSRTQGAVEQKHFM